jgi:hypothetical protein
MPWTENNQSAGSPELIGKGYRSRRMTKAFTGAGQGYRLHGNNLHGKISP